MSAEEAGAEPSATPSSEPAPTSKAFDLEKQKGACLMRRGLPPAPPSTARCARVRLPGRGGGMRSATRAPALTEAAVSAWCASGGT